MYVFDYGAPTGFRIAAKHPERITAIISQNGNAYEEGLSEGWNPIRAYWQEPSNANRKALRAFLSPQTTRWQYTHGVTDETTVSPDSQSLDNFYLPRPGADEIQLDLFGDYKSDADAMQANMDATDGAVLAERATFLLAEKMGKQKAGKLVEQALAKGGFVCRGARSARDGARRHLCPSHDAHLSHLSR
jgi:pimeloyl-ACP methyl ester carboxylesterase